MLTSIFQSHLGGGGFYVPGAAEAAKLSLEFGYQARARKDAIDRLMEGGRAVHQGLRLDSANLGGGDASKRRRVAEAAFLAAEHVQYGSPLGRFSVETKGRMDAAVPMASQGLVSIYKQVFEIEHAELAAWSGMICKIDTQVDPAAETYAWYEKDIVGVPRAASSYDAASIPMVNGPVAAQNLGNIVPALVGWETNFMEPRRAALAKRNGKPDFMIDAGKIEACKQVIAQFFDALWLYGDPSLGIDGLHNTPYKGGLVTAPAAAWSALTINQLTDELNKLFNWIPNRTQGRLGDIKRVKVFLPPSQYDLITKPTFLPGGLVGPSPWEAFAKGRGLSLDNIVKVHQLASANSAIWTGGPLGLAADRTYVIYEKGDMWDPHFILSQPIEVPAAPRPTNFGEVMMMHARGGGIRIADAERVFYYEGL